MWSTWKVDGVPSTIKCTCLFVHLSRLDSQTMIRSSHLTMYSSMYIWRKHCMFHCHTNIPHTARKDTNKSQKQKKTSLPPTAFDKFLSSARMYLLSWKYFHAYIEWATQTSFITQLVQHSEVCLGIITHIHCVYYVAGAALWGVTHISIKRALFHRQKIPTALYTRMQSSRMRTVRCSSRLLLGGVCSGGCLPRGDVSQYAPRQTLPLPPLWTEFLTHASENITLPQLRCGR